MSLLVKAVKVIKKSEMTAKHTAVKFEGGWKVNKTLHIYTSDMLIYFTDII